MSFGRNGPHTKRFPSGAKAITFNLNTAKLHTYVSPEKSFGNATHVVESPNYVTVVDTQYSVPYSKEFRSYVDSIGKPIAGVIISHAHPDHYFGLTSAFSDVPSYALPEVVSDIKTKGPEMIKESKKNMGDLVPDHVTIPTNILQVGEVIVDGIKYRYRKFDKAEADTQAVIELPDLNTVIVQDAVYNGYHPWLGQYTDNWIRLLDTLEKEYKNDSIVLVGHGNPASPTIYPVMRKYLKDSQRIMKDFEGDTKQIEQELIKMYPNYKGRHIIPMYLSYMQSNNNNTNTNDRTRNPVNWFEIPTADLDRAIRFYEGLLGYSLKRVPPFPSEPSVEMAWFPMEMNNTGAGGSLVKGPQYQPCMKGTLIYFLSPSGDLNNELGKVEELGGKILLNKRIISEDIGYMGIFLDSEGNRIALHSKN